MSILQLTVKLFFLRFFPYDFKERKVVFYIKAAIFEHCI